jgi:hypothetical protein
MAKVVEFILEDILLLKEVGGKQKLEHENL